MKLCRDTIRRPEDQRSQPVNRRRCGRSEASAMPDRPRQAAHRQPGRLARGEPVGCFALSTACAAARCRALPASSPGGTANVEAPQPWQLASPPFQSPRWPARHSSTRG